MDISKEIFVEGEIKSIFTKDTHFGAICNTTDEDGTYYNQLSIYSENGWKRCERKLKDSYSKVEMLDNNEICLIDGKNVAIYSLLGIKKFSYHFDTGIYKVISGDAFKRYYFITDHKISNMRLK